MSEFGRPRTTKDYIVDHIFTLVEIKDFDWTFFTLVPKLMENDVDMAASLGLLANSNKCGSCEIPRILTKRTNNIDGYRWECRMRTCRSTNSIREGSFMAGSHLKIKQIIMLLFCWSLDLQQNIIQKQISVSSRTIVDWMQFIREVCEQDILNNPIMLGGIDEASNSSKEVEINESFFFKRKYNRGQIKDDVWIFGAVERGSNHCNLTTVQRRERDALFPIIRSWILPGTRIISDGWADYKGLDQFEHGMYAREHDHEKRKIQKILGARQDMFELHFVEFMWRHREKGEVFPRLIQCIRSQYSFNVS